MSGQFSAHVTDRFVLPHLSEFTEAEIPDLGESHPQSGFWLPNYILNSVMRGSFVGPRRELCFHFLRAASIAFDEHRSARERTIEFLEDRSKLVTIVQGMYHWEQFLGASWRALVLGFRWAGRDPRSIFERGAGSLEERANRLYNSMKHVDSEIEAGRLPPLGPSPVWLTNGGLQGVDARVGFDETGFLLADLRTIADALEDPREADARLSELAEGQSSSDS